MLLRQRGCSSSAETASSLASISSLEMRGSLSHCFIFLEPMAVPVLSRIEQQRTAPAVFNRFRNLQVTKRGRIQRHVRIRAVDPNAPHVPQVLFLRFVQVVEQCTRRKKQKRCLIESQSEAALVLGVKLILDGAPAEILRIILGFPPCEQSRIGNQKSIGKRRLVRVNRIGSESPLRQFSPSSARMLLASLVPKTARAENSPGRNVAIRQPRSTTLCVQRGQVVIFPLAVSMLWLNSVPGVTMRTDFASDNALCLRGIFDLFADGHFMAFIDELSDVTVGCVVWNAAHRRLLFASAGSAWSALSPYPWKR